MHLTASEAATEVGVSNDFSPFVIFRDHLYRLSADDISQTVSCPGTLSETLHKYLHSTYSNFHVVVFAPIREIRCLRGLQKCNPILNCQTSQVFSSMLIDFDNVESESESMCNIVSGGNSAVSNYL